MCLKSLIGTGYNSVTFCNCEYKNRTSVELDTSSLFEYIMVIGTEVDVKLYDSGCDVP